MCLHYGTYKKNNYYLMKCEFKLILNDNQYCPNITSELYSSKTMCYWHKLLQNVVKDFKDKGYNFNHIAEMNIITIVNELDMSYDFYIKQNMHAVEWKLNVIINKNNKLIIKLDRSKRHSLIRK